MASSIYDRIAAECRNAGYSDVEIARGIAYAEEIGWSTTEEAMSLTVSRILYGDKDLAAGERFPVEPGSLSD